MLFISPHIHQRAHSTKRKAKRLARSVRLVLWLTKERMSARNAAAIARTRHQAKSSVPCVPMEW